MLKIGAGPGRASEQVQLRQTISDGAAAETVRWMMSRKERETSGTQTRRLNWNYIQIFARDRMGGGWRTGTRPATWNEMNNNRILGEEEEEV